MSAPTEFLTWRRMRNEGLAVEFGWLTLSSFHWIAQTPAPLDSFPGIWSANTQEAQVDLSAADAVTDLDGNPLSGTISRHLEEGDSIHFVRSGDVLVELGVRDGRYMVRTRNRSHETLQNFSGVPTFEYDPTFKVSGHFIPYESPRLVKIGSFRADANFTTELVGEIEFTLGGTPQRLAATEHLDGSLVLAFRDATNGLSTAAWRFVSVPAPAADGTALIDFNRTLNYPMAFSPYAVCPAPVAENQLTCAVTAGEKMP